LGGQWFGYAGRGVLEPVIDSRLSQRWTVLAPDTAACCTPPIVKYENVRLTGAGAGRNRPTARVDDNVTL